MMRDFDDGHDRWDGLVRGFGFIMLGAIFLLHYLGLLPWKGLGAWWPLVVIGFGGLRLLVARRPRRIGGAVTMILMGVWFLLAANHLYGLYWSTSWPLALVAVGAGIVARALAAFVLSDDRPCIVRIDEEHRHDGA